MKEHACASCSFVAEEDKEACASAKLKRLMALPTFNEAAWTVVKEELRPPLSKAVMAKDWEEVARLWRQGKQIVERAVLGS